MGLSVAQVHDGQHGHQNSAHVSNDVSVQKRKIADMAPDATILNTKDGECVANFLPASR